MTTRIYSVPLVGAEYEFPDRVVRAEQLEARFPGNIVIRSYQASAPGAGNYVCKWLEYPQFADPQDLVGDWMLFGRGDFDQVCAFIADTLAKPAPELE